MCDKPKDNGKKKCKSTCSSQRQDESQGPSEQNVDFQGYGPDISGISASGGYDPQESPNLGRTDACKNKMDGVPCGSRQPKTPENIPVEEDSGWQTLPRNDRYGRSASCQEKVGSAPCGARQPKTPKNVPVEDDSGWQTLPRNDRYGRSASCQEKVGSPPCSARQPKTPKNVPVEEDSGWQTLPRNDRYGRSATCQEKVGSPPCGARQPRTPENVPVAEDSGYHTIPFEDEPRSGFETMPATPEYPEYARTNVCQQKLGSPMIYGNDRATSYSFEKRAQSTPLGSEQYYSLTQEPSATMSGYYDSSFPKQPPSPPSPRAVTPADMSRYERTTCPSPPPFQSPPSAQYYPQQSSPELCAANLSKSSVPTQKRSLEKPPCGPCPDSKIGMAREQGKKRKTDTYEAAGKRPKSTQKPPSTYDTIEVYESPDRSEAKKSALKKESTSPERSPTRSPRVSISSGKPSKTSDLAFARKQSESMLRRKELGNVSIHKYALNKNEELEQICNVSPPSATSTSMDYKGAENYEPEEKLDLKQRLSCCMSMPSCCRPPRSNPTASRFAHLSESLKNLKADDKRLLEARQDSINMLSVVISTVMLLAVDVPNIPPKYLHWSNKYLSCIKNLQGQHPINVKKILAMINRKERVSPVATPVEPSPEPPKKGDTDKSKKKEESSVPTTRIIPTYKYDYCACPYIPRLSTVQRQE